MSDVQPSYKVVDRQIGLLGGTVLLVGTVIGISVFLLPGELIGDAGPSIIFSLLITAIPMIFAVLMLLQLGGAMPVAGGAYVYASRLISPRWGFLIVFLVIPGIWTTLLFTSIGFAEFTRFFVDVPAPVLMAGVLTLFLLLNLRGINLVAWVQIVMVSAILLGFLAFVLPGAGRIETANYTPMFPEGTGPFLIAIVSLYIPFQGFTMIVELGEELKDPIRNIPRVLLLGMTIAVLFSLALVVVFVGLDSWDVLAGFEEGGIAEAADEYLPTGVGAAVAIAAVLGALTTLNAVITSYSRTIMRAARDEVLNLRLADIHPRTRVPHWSIVVLSVPPILLVPIAPSAVILSVILAMVILFGGFISAIALWNLPKRFPEAYENSLYKLPMPVLKMAAIGSAASAVVFFGIVVIQALPIAIMLLLLAWVGSAYYRYRVRVCAKRGINLDRRLKLLHAHEAVEADVSQELSAPPADAAGPDGDGAGARRPPRRLAVPPPPSMRDESAAETDEIPARPDEDGLRAISEIKGVGPAKAEALLARFGSLHAVAAADPSELMEVRGVGEALANTIHEELRQRAR